MPSTTEFPVESLIAGRTPRSTAGNRLATLLHQEADKDDTLFLEDEDDVEFLGDEEGGDESDVRFNSSSEESGDEGPPKEGEEDAEKELEGERELQREVREQRKSERRKRQEAFLKPRAGAAVTAMKGGLRREKVKKKVTIVEDGEKGAESGGDAASSGVDIMNETLGGRPRKKSERISWVPAADVAVRSSSRTLSVANKERTHQRLQESQKRRLQIIASMDAAKEKADTKPKKKEMTQAERLAEAAITERKNRKSLNRWEESEMARVQAQRARLAALHQRRLEGPVIRMWSGRAEYDSVSGKLRRYGKIVVEEEEQQKEKEKEKAKGGRKKVVSEEDEKMEDAPEPTSAEQTPAEGAPADSTPTDGTTAPATEKPAEEPAPPKEPSPPPPPPPPPAPPAYATKTIVILDNFDPPPHTREQTSKILFPHSNPNHYLDRYYSSRVRHDKHNHEICPVTSQDAKYRDPKTGIAYSGLRAYKEIQKVVSGEIVWSQMLGCYVGSMQDAAAGVPEGFL